MVKVVTRIIIITVIINVITSNIIIVVVAMVISSSGSCVVVVVAAPSMLAVVPAVVIVVWSVYHYGPYLNDNTHSRHGVDLPFPLVLVHQLLVCTVATAKGAKSQT